MVHIQKKKNLKIQKPQYPLKTSVKPFSPHSVAHGKCLTLLWAGCLHGIPPPPT